VSGFSRKARSSLSGQSYDILKLRFSNGTTELNITEAESAEWLDINFQYWGWVNVEYDFVYISEDYFTIRSWKGYFVNSFKDNITLIRQN